MLVFLIFAIPVNAQTKYTDDTSYTLYFDMPEGFSKDGKVYMRYWNDDGAGDFSVVEMTYLGKSYYKGVLPEVTEKQRVVFTNYNDKDSLKPYQRISAYPSPINNRKEQIIPYPCGKQNENGLLYTEMEKCDLLEELYYERGKWVCFDERDIFNQKVFFDVPNGFSSDSKVYCHYAGDSGVYTTVEAESIGESYYKAYIPEDVYVKELYFSNKIELNAETQKEYRATEIIYVNSTQAEQTHPLPDNAESFNGLLYTDTQQTQGKYINGRWCNFNENYVNGYKVYFEMPDEYMWYSDHIVCEYEEDDGEAYFVEAEHFRDDYYQAIIPFPEKVRKIRLSNMYPEHSSSASYYVTDTIYVNTEEALQTHPLPNGKESYNGLLFTNTTVDETDGNIFKGGEWVPFCENPREGDIDFDGVFTIKDVTTIQKGLAQVISFTKDQNKFGDYNADGVVSIHDATQMQKALLG